MVHLSLWRKKLKEKRIDRWTEEYVTWQQDHHLTDFSFVFRSVESQHVTLVFQKLIYIYIYIYNFCDDRHNFEFEDWVRIKWLRKIGLSRKISEEGSDRASEKNPCFCVISRNKSAKTNSSILSSEEKKENLCFVIVSNHFRIDREINKAKRIRWTFHDRSKKA